MLSTGAAQGRMLSCTALPGPGQAVWLSSCYTNNSQEVCKQLYGLIWPLFSEERGEWLKAGRDCSSARLLLDSRDAAANHTLKKLTFYLRGDIFFFKYIVCQILRGAGKMNKARTEREEWTAGTMSLSKWKGMRCRVWVGFERARMTHAQ